MQEVDWGGDSTKNENVEKVRPVKDILMSRLAFWATGAQSPWVSPRNNLEAASELSPQRTRMLRLGSTTPFTCWVKVLLGRMTPTLGFSVLSMRFPPKPKAAKPRVATPGLMRGAGKVHEYRLVKSGGHCTKSPQVCDLGANITSHYHLFGLA